jgi:hypothetical protein
VMCPGRRGESAGRRSQVVSFCEFRLALDLRELTEVGLTVRDTDLRLVHRKEFADSVSGSVTAADP